MFAVARSAVTKRVPRLSHRAVLLAALPALALSAACGESATEPPPSDAVISLDKTGGFAGVDFAILVDGPTAVVVGNRCVNFCDWEDGDVLANVTPEALRELEQKFDAIDYLAGADEDFGTECCDQFLYELSFSRGDETRTVMGTSEKLPAEILALILEVEAWVAAEREGDGA